MNSFKRVRVFQIELFGIWKCWFLRRGETGVPGEKPLGAGERMMIDQRMKEQIKSREIKPSCPISGRHIQFIIYREFQKNWKQTPLTIVRGKI